MWTTYIDGSYSTKFRIVSDDLNIIEHLQMIYPTKTLSNPTHEYLEIVSFEDEGGVFVLCGKNKVYTKKPLRVICDFIHRECAFIDGIVAFHGAAVEVSGKAHLFLGETKSGKSTLTAFLTLCGLPYVTDDCIEIDKDTMCVSANTAKPIMLREGGYQALQKYDRNICCHIKKLDYLSPPRYAYWPMNQASEPLPIAGIYFIERNCKENMVKDLTHMEKMILLLKSPIVACEITGNYLNFVNRLASLPCKQLLYSDLDFVLKVISNE